MSAAGSEAGSEGVRAALRAEALALFGAGVAAADPGPATARALAARLGEGRRPVTLLALGKAAVAMAEAALSVLDSPVRRGVLVTTAAAARPVPGLRVIAGGHPVPDAGSLEGGEALLEAARAAGAGAQVIALVSGGGSALAVAPAAGFSLADKQAVNAALLASGADITLMNALRARLSRLKGGGLARAAGAADLLALVLSDVPGDDPAVVASGPTVAAGDDEAAFAGALERLREAACPPALLARLEGLGRPSPAGAPEGARETVVIAGNAISREAMAGAVSGRRVHTLEGWLAGDVGAVAERLWHEAHRLAATEAGPAALLAGGETTVRLAGSGLGGRNQELALRLALLAEARPLGRPFAVLSGGTDGRDGPTEAAGGLVDAGTPARIRSAGLDPAALLADNDSHPALAASGDLVMTGATGTNVADLQVLLIGHPAA